MPQPFKRLSVILGVGMCVVALTLLWVSEIPPSTAHARSASKTRGGQLFAQTGCVHCHGVAGISGGDGPSLADIRKRRKPAEIYTQIHDGGKSMPAFGDDLNPKQINDLVDYLRSKRSAPIQ